MKAYIIALAGLAVFDLIVYIYMWYDVKADDINLRAKWNKLKEQLTEEE